MTKQLWVAIGVLLAEGSHAADSVPADVSEYVMRRDVCEHFRAEPWPEGASEEERERRGFISAQLKHYCEDSDQALLELRAKYRDDQMVTDRLEKYDAYDCTVQAGSEGCTGAIRGKAELGTQKTRSSR